MEPPLGSGPYKVGKFEQGRLRGIRARQGLVGRQPADHARPVQFRRAALRLLPRPRHRVRRLHRQELHVPRGVHLAGLGDALRLPGGQGRPRQAREHSRRAAFRHAGLDDQHAAREIPGRSGARGLRLRLRFRVGEQEPDVRHLCADAVLLPELRHDGEGQAVARRNWRCSSRSRTSCARRCSARPGIRRSATARARTAGCCGDRRSCSTPPAGPSRRASASTPRASR